jgi:hypothetical protein
LHWLYQYDIESQLEHVVETEASIPFPTGVVELLMSDGNTNGGHAFKIDQRRPMEFGTCCCAQQTGMHIFVVEALLIILS